MKLRTVRLKALCKRLAQSLSMVPSPFSRTRVCWSVCDGIFYNVDTLTPSLTFEGAVTCFNVLLVWTLGFLIRDSFVFFLFIIIFSFVCFF